MGEKNQFKSRRVVDVGDETGEGKWKNEAPSPKQSPVS